ncbi:MAG: nitroreductase/quinone reductase family protein [Pseudonocardiaceae bacterium]
MVSTRSDATVPRGLITATLAALALVWGLYTIKLGGGLVSAAVQSGVYLGLLVLTIRSRRVKILLVRTVQRYTINPLMRLLLAIGINPLGVAILETRGHSSAKLRRVPVGNGRKGDSFWIIAEHGTRAGYVRNIAHDPNVRVRLRVGLRYRWVPGIATIRPDDDPLARQRAIIAWHPLRTLNAINVRVLGADLLTVHVQLDLNHQTLEAADAEGHGRRETADDQLAHTGAQRRVVLAVQRRPAHDPRSPQEPPTPAPDPRPPRPDRSSGIDRRGEPEGCSPQQVVPVNEQQRRLIAGAVGDRHRERRLGERSDHQLTTFTSRPAMWAGR